MNLTVIGTVPFFECYRNTAADILPHGSKVIDGNLDFFSMQDVHDDPLNQIIVKGIRVVKVVVPLEGLFPLTASEFSIETLLRDAHHSLILLINGILAQFLHDLPTDSGLA